MTVPAGWVSINSGFYLKPADNSGPYVFDGTTMTLVGTGTGSSASPTPPNTGTQTSVASSAADVTILAANAGRKGATISNDDANALLLLLGAGTSSATAYSVKLFTDDYIEIPAGYTGIIKGIWLADGAGSARVTEFTIV